MMMVCCGAVLCTCDLAPTLLSQPDMCTQDILPMYPGTSVSVPEGDMT